MLNVVLYEPDIPPNTGNIIRLCANAGARLHLIYPLGFDLSQKQLRRAGLDYSDLTSVVEHDDFNAFLEAENPGRLWGCTTKASQSYCDVAFGSEDYLLFGPETRGLPGAVLDDLGQERCIRIPMQPASRSLNLSNSCAVILYEAWRQLGFS
jgi:tRNA (cytidine/uridine-2'-O-)-methyltransferase